MTLPITSCTYLCPNCEEQLSLFEVETFRPPIKYPKSQGICKKCGSEVIYMEIESKII